MQPYESIEANIGRNKIILSSLYQSNPGTLEESRTLKTQSFRFFSELSGLSSNMYLSRESNFRGLYPINRNMGTVKSYKAHKITTLSFSFF